MELKNFALGLIICFLLSFCLGVERQFRRRYIGLRTMILVSIGSYAFVSFSFLLTGYEQDITRIASQVVAGIGFLGAGVIIKDNEKNKIKGLTTAATLWCDAGIGVLCAGGYVQEAVIVTALVLFSNIILRYVNKMIINRIEEKNINEVFEINLNNVKSPSEVVLKIENYIPNNNLTVEKVNVEAKDIEIIVSIRKDVDNKLDKFVSKIVTEFNINNYSYSKISETKNEDETEL